MGAGSEASSRVVLLLLGVALTILGLAGPQQYALLLGPNLLAGGVAVLAARRIPGRIAASALAVFVLAWSTASLPIGASLGTPLAIPLFLVQGLLMTAAAITLLVAQEDRVARFLVA